MTREQLEHAIRTACQIIRRKSSSWARSRSSPATPKHGFSIDGLDLKTAVLPSGWRDRLVRLQNINTAAPAGSPQFTGWCLDKEDLCVAKLCAYREKDLNFVRALLAAGMVRSSVIAERLATVDEELRTAARRPLEWIRSYL